MHAFQLGARMIKQNGRVDDRRDARLAHLLRDLLKEDETLCIGDNKPYSVDDHTDYTIPVHGERRRIPHALFELRHDMIEDKEDQYRWAHRLAHSLERALDHSPELGMYRYGGRT